MSQRPQKSRSLEVVPIAGRQSTTPSSEPIHFPEPAIYHTLAVLEKPPRNVAMDNGVHRPPAQGPWVPCVFVEAARSVLQYLATAVALEAFGSSFHWAAT